MAFRCFVCFTWFKTVDAICSHLKLQHALFEGKLLVLHCCFDSCNLEFRDYKTFRDHLRTHTSQKLVDNDLPSQKRKRVDISLDAKIADSVDYSSKATNLECCIQETQSLVEDIQSTSYENSIKITVDSNVVDSFTSAVSNLKCPVQETKLLTVDIQCTPYEKFIMDLDSSSLPKTEIDKIVAATSNLVDGLLQNVSNMFLEEKISPPQQYNDFVSKQKAAMQKVSSRYKRNKFYVEKPSFV